MSGSLWRVLGVSLVAAAALGCNGESDESAEGAGGAPAGGGGPIACASPADPNGGKVACPGWSAGALTALEGLAKMESIAAGTGAPSIWMGGVMGMAIGRDGKPSSDMLALWTYGFCLGDRAPMSSDADIDDGLNLSINATDCLATRTCQSLDCSPVVDAPTPSIDSDAAIAAAFPSEGADARYGLSYTAAIGNYWSVTSSASGTTVKIDATTGAVVP